MSSCGPEVGWARARSSRPGNYKIIKRKLRNVRIRWELEDNEDGVNLPSSKGGRARPRGWRGAESRRSRTRRLNVCIVGSSSLAHDYLYDPYIFPIRTLSLGDKFDSFWTFDTANSDVLVWRDSVYLIICERLKNGIQIFIARDSSSVTCHIYIVCDLAF